MVMDYDARHGRTVLFGGQVKGLPKYGDTWLFDGTDWTQAAPATSPSARTEAGMAYDLRRKVLVLFGGNTDNVADGSNTMGDTWTWDGTDWTQVA
jgi:hypothetical protein